MDLSSYPFHQLSQSAEAGSQSLLVAHDRTCGYHA